MNAASPPPARAPETRAEARPESSPDARAETRRPRVLIVDDAVVVRGLFGRWIEADGRFEVLPTCADGQSAIAAAKKHRPQVIVLDLEMPVMDGMTALPEIIAASPDSAVLIASTLTRRNAKLSMRCLALGAAEVLPKPDSNRDLTLSTSFREEFIAKIAGLAGAQVNALRPARAPTPAQPPTSPSAQAATPRAPAMRAPAIRELRPSQSLAGHVSQLPRYIVIGASTGGPRAVAQVLSDIKTVLPHVATLIVQHMPPMFTASFAEQMQAQIGMPVREPADGERIQQGAVYIAPGGRHMGVVRENGQPAIRISDGPPVKFCRPSVDVLFADVAKELGNSALAMVLTGMGSDGCDGSKLLRQAGVAVIAQDEASSVVWGMPGAVTKAGLASLVLPLTDIGPSIRELIASQMLMASSRRLERTS
jgi:two-component system chemotaxis response regulator CheB